MSKPKPWGECHLCRGTGVVFEGNDGTELQCSCAAARRTAFEEALAACAMVIDSFESMGVDIGVGVQNHPGLSGAQACDATIRARMEDR